MLKPVVYDKDSVDELVLRTQYEIYFLEAAYEIAEAPIFPRFPDQLVYPPDGRTPNRTIYGSGHIKFGDWRTEFLDIGAPLVFATSFKVFDMLLEWILAINGESSTYRFAQKLAALKDNSGPIFPPFIEQRPYLRDRLIAIYDQLTPLRGTIAHNHEFTSSNGTITVSRTSKGQIGPPIAISRAQVRELATLAVALVHYVTNKWTTTSFREKQLRRTLDNIQNLHLLPLLGQKEPTKLTVRIFKPTNSTFDVDVGKIRSDILENDADRDVEFDIRVITVNHDASVAIAYLIPWERLESHSGLLSLTIEELKHLQCNLPEDIDLASVACKLYGVTEKDSCEAEGEER